jgi:hypothetical protein
LFSVGGWALSTTRTSSEPLAGWWTIIVIAYSKNCKPEGMEGSYETSHPHLFIRNRVLDIAERIGCGYGCRSPGAFWPG